MKAKFIANERTLSLALKAARAPYDRTIHAARGDKENKQNREVLEALLYVKRTGKICTKIIEKYKTK